MENGEGTSKAPAEDQKKEGKPERLDKDTNEDPPQAYAKVKCGLEANEDWRMIAAVEEQS